MTDLASWRSGDLRMGERSDMAGFRGAARAAGLLALLMVAGCGFGGGPVGNPAVPEPAKQVEIARYLGLWYEMARYEAPFQEGCEGVTADYALNGDGTIRVVNTCREGAPDGPARQSVGKAKVVPGSGNAKLRVSFFGPFYGDYWVLDRAEDYSWAIVGEPSGRYLWMLTRAAMPDPATRALIEKRVRDMGYDWSLVRVTRQ